MPLHIGSSLHAAQRQAHEFAAGGARDALPEARVWTTTRRTDKATAIGLLRCRIELRTAGGRELGCAALILRSP